MQQHCKAHAQGIETELPYKKPKKPVPVKAAQVMLLQSAGEWLWLQRPNSGLWGGLWCLPIFEQSDEFQRQSQQLGLKHILSHTQISHSFTHFTWLLDATAFTVSEDQKEHLAIELNAQWFTPEQATALGIPTAMKKLISAVNL